MESKVFGKSVKKWLFGGKAEPDDMQSATELVEMSKRLVYERPAGKFIPQQFAEGVEVIDFWNTVYCGNSEDLEKFCNSVFLNISGNGHDMELRNVSFSKAVLRGKVRPMYVIKRNVARATLNIAHLSDDMHIYVSLRLLFQGEISQWKSSILFVLALFLAVPSALISFWPLWGELGVEKVEYVRGRAQMVTDWENGLIAFLIALVVSAVIISMIRQLWSLWRYGDSRALEREDMDELYRDDLSALGTEIVLAVTSTADELDLDKLTIEGEKPPTFATSAQTNRTKRRPRF